MTDDRDWITIGRVAGAFGVHGELKVEPLTDSPRRFEQLRVVWVGPANREMAIAGARENKRQVLLKLAGIETPEQARGLMNLELRIPRSQAMTLPEGHYFLEDLIGMSVSTTAGHELGAVTDVLRTGSNDVYVVNSGNKAILVPGIRDAVADLDLAGRRIIIEPWVLEVE